MEDEKAGVEAVGEEEIATSEHIGTEENPRAIRHHFAAAQNAKRGTRRNRARRASPANAGRSGGYAPEVRSRWWRVKRETRGRPVERSCREGGRCVERAASVPARNASSLR